MEEFNTMLPNMYRCKIEPTGETLTRIVEFELPMNPKARIEYTQEREICVKFPESDFKQFIHDFDNWCEMLQVAKDHPHIQTDYQQLMILVKLLS
jgi:hypothetical protein